MLAAVHAINRPLSPGQYLRVRLANEATMASRRRRGGPVTCVACGATVDRADAREYDPAGNRWDRDGKEFDFLCKACHDDACHLPRTGLEALLLEVGTDHATPREFLAAYYAAVRDAEESPTA